MWKKNIAIIFEAICQHTTYCLPLRLLKITTYAGHFFYITQRVRTEHFAKMLRKCVFQHRLSHLPLPYHDHQLVSTQ